MKRMRGQLVSIVNIGQFVFAAIMAYCLLDEMPGAAFVPASLLVVLGAVTALVPTGGFGRTPRVPAPVPD